jgi:hypothetical protein
MSCEPVRPGPERLLAGWMTLITTLLITLGTALTLGMAPALAQDDPIVIQPYPSLSFSQITDIQPALDGSSRVFVVQKGGVIDVFDAATGSPSLETYLDLSGTVNTEGEGGLVGLAFHPDYANTGRFFVYYTTTDGGDFVSRISEFSVSLDDPDRAEPASELVRLQLVQPGFYHNSGQVQFGPDGYLYVAFGDGIASFEDGAGGVADPFNHGQNPGTLFSSMIRIDVDGGGSAPDCGGDGANESADYGIPADNPFTGIAGACDEIHAYGFRNPFRFSFDDSGRLWLADVGEEQREEINWIDAGGNYGWKTTEGSLCFDPATGCDRSGLDFPVWEYAHPAGGGGRSVTGGYVVPEGGCPFYTGDYIFGDFVTGQIWRLDPEDAPFQSSELLLDTDLMISTFGRTPNGALLIGDYDSGGLFQFDCASLPVELVDFRGWPSESGALLTWTTASETNNAGFDILHRSPNADRWVDLGFVVGSGTTSSPSNYSFETEDLRPGTHAFRLRQMDVDGTRTLSQEILVEIGLGEALQLVGPDPNPVVGRGALTLTSARTQPVSVRLFDVLGREVAVLLNDTVTGGSPRALSVPANRLASGTYFLRVDASSGMITRKITIAQ